MKIVVALLTFLYFGTSNFAVVNETGKSLLADSHTSLRTMKTNLQKSFLERRVLGDDDAVMACAELFKPEYVDQMCCENLKSIEKLDGDIKECNKKATSEEQTCAEYECFLKNKGLLENGKIIDNNTVAFLDDIAKTYPKEKNIIERVKTECLDGQYEEYPPDEDCMALKFYVCAYINIMLECDSWKNTAVCKQASDLAKKCTSPN